MILDDSEEAKREASVAKCFTAEVTDEANAVADKARDVSPPDTALSRLRLSCEAAEGLLPASDEEAPNKVEDAKEGLIVDASATKSPN